MPTILSRDAEPLWLDDGLRDPLALGSLLTPYPDGALEAYRVSALVNRPSNDGPEVIVPEGEEVTPFRSGQPSLKLFQLPPAWSRRHGPARFPGQDRLPGSGIRPGRTWAAVAAPGSSTPAGIFVFPEKPPLPRADDSSSLT